MTRISSLTGRGYEGGWYTNRAIFPCRYRLFYGARNTKKSVDIMGYEIIFKILDNELRNVIVVRKNDNDNAGSTYNNLVNLLTQLGLEGPGKFRCYTSPHKIVYEPTGQEIIFRGMNNPTSLTSVKPAHGYITDLYFEEFEEIQSYDDFLVVDGSLRGRMPEGLQMQITMCMNPYSIRYWQYEKFVKGRMEDDYDYLMTHDYRECYDPDFTTMFGKGLYLHQSTYKINEFRSPDYDVGMLDAQRKTPELFKVFGLGMWGNTTNVVYPEWNDSLILKPEEVMKMSFSRFAIGIDTGLSDGQGKIRKDGTIKSATTAILVGMTSDYSKVVALDEWYWTNTNGNTPKSADEILDMARRAIMEWSRKYYNNPTVMKGQAQVYVDNADLIFRQLLEARCLANSLNVKMWASTKLPIQLRVDFERTMLGWDDMQFSSDCKNLIRELKNARRGERNGEARMDLDDHTINAWEYGWAPFRGYIMKWKQFKAR